MTRLILQDCASNAINTLVTPGFASRNRAPIYYVTKQFSTSDIPPVGDPSNSKIETVALTYSNEFENWFMFSYYLGTDSTKPYVFNRIEFMLNDLVKGGV